MYKNKHDRSVKLYIYDILDSIRRIKKYTKGMDYKKFSNDELVVDGVIKNFLVMGEAIKNISPKFMKDNKDIPWKQIIGMRNKMIHEYFGIDLIVVWDTIENSLPSLEKEIKKLKMRV